MTDTPTPSDPEAAEPPRQKAQLPLWALPTITGAAGIVIGILIGGVGVGLVQFTQQAAADSQSAEAAAELERRF